MRHSRRAALAALSLFAVLLPARLALAEDPSRIVSIGGATTETLYRLGEEKRIAAVDSTSLFPETARALPNVGYMRALSAEGVLSLAPDLILMEEGAGPPDAVMLIDKAGVPVAHIPSGHDAAGLGGKIRAIGAAIGAGAKAEALAAETERDLANLAKETGAIEKRRRVLFILSLKDDRPLAAGDDTAADAMIRLAGGENVLAGTKGYKGLSWEAATALQPDVVLMMDRGGPEHEGSAFALPALAATPAGRDKALIKMDALYLLGFGPRTPAAARDLAHRLYPAAVRP